MPSQYLTILLLFVFLSCGNNTTSIQRDTIDDKPPVLPINKWKVNFIPTEGPKIITRTIIKDENDIAWIAAFDGMYKYEDSSFYHTMKGICDDRFFSVLQAREGEVWMGSIGSGVFVMRGDSIYQYTIESGLVSNMIVSVFQDNNGHLWFGGNGGLSYFNGRHFKNYLIKDKALVAVEPGETHHAPDVRPPMEVNSIIQDDDGKIWAASRGATYILDQEKFNIVQHEDLVFTNVRTLLKDKDSVVWMGGDDGLWSYGDKGFQKWSENFTGYLFEDHETNIWTSSQRTSDRKWVLTKYQNTNGLKKLLEVGLPYEENGGMLFGIEQVDPDVIWVGTLNGIASLEGDSLTQIMR